jgi:hypothetical protein
MSHSTEAQKREAGPANPRPYHAPQLPVYGAIREMTGSGSKAQMENAAMTGTGFKP